MSNPLILGKDLTDLVIPQACIAYTAIVAAGSGDNTAIVGLTIDRENLTPNGQVGTLVNVVPFGALFLVNYEAVLQAAQTLTLKNALVQDSADGSTWATVFDQTGVAGQIPPSWPVAGVVDTGATGGSTQRGVVAYGTDVRKCRRYIRFGFTPDLSASGTDTGKLMVTGVLSGIDELPPGVV